ncbi:penicillin-binding transpeptidase domain-containing protein [Kutzneria kofuensis]|uniref:Cell division protein FtsI/penicillin-binding protein 2 n=1 Tax=Kutzneria kofuensis TaxID=103725 RepID=A0A7W9KKU8_9PSEU|nr:penicillin-binding transpeptidase domain-containing protein [Kutzneria kofuensis]MBB5894153.1 cell division protein FtsI/penicillin-binding protein 2 [Kutzneria kofuensis]
MPRKLPLVVAFALVLPLSACGLFESKPSQDDIAKNFLADFAKGDTAAAAQLTDDANASKALMDKVRTALKPTGVTLTAGASQPPSGDTATVPFNASWNLGKDRTWTYQGSLAMTQASGDWRVHWQPEDVHPKLSAQQSIALTVLQPDPAPVLDRDGAPLLAPTPVISISLDRKQAGDLNSVATALAAALNRFDNTITAQSIIDGASKTPDGQAYSIVNLRDADYQTVKPQIHELPGVSFATQTQLLAQNKSLGPQFLSTIKTAVNTQVAGAAGWRVVTKDAAGNDVADLAGKDPQPAKSLTTTIGTGIQAAAQAAIAGVQQPAAIVAMQPSTGEVLAVAQNAPADAQGLIALTGQFPPGSTFKIVTGVSALEAGKVTLDGPLPCPGKTTIDGRVIPNENEFDLGTVPLRTAFAQSCNTTFSQIAATQLTSQQLADTAKQMGIGADFNVPGVVTVTGSVPVPTSTVERAEDGFGQGKDQVSPFGMALVASTVVKGSIPTPTLIRGTETKVNTPAQQPVPGPVLDSMRQMMRAVVTDGTAKAIRDIPDVAGKTGTAQFGDGTNSHGWFVGYRGDLAFAVLLVGAGSSSPAVVVAGNFLRAVK